MSESDISLTKSLIENIYRKDLSMEEKGLGVYAYFQSEGITLEKKAIVGSISVIDRRSDKTKKDKRRRKN